MKKGVRFSTGYQLFSTGALSVFLMLSSTFTTLSPTFQLGVLPAYGEDVDERLIRLRTNTIKLIDKQDYKAALDSVITYETLIAKIYGQRHDQFCGALELRARIYRHLKRPDDALIYENRAASLRIENQAWTAKLHADLEKARNQLENRKMEMRARILQEYREQKQE